MNGWLDWREIEMRNDWGVREKTDDMGREWDRSAAMWDARWKGEEEFTKRQADALEFLSTDIVLDIGCGTGPLTMNVAPRVKRIIAQDFGDEMLALVRKNAAERGLSNVETLQGNWHDMEPGVDLPICDVAICRWSPAQGDILKMSRCATRRCYSISTCAPRFEKDGSSHGGYWCRSTIDESLNTSPRPCARKYGFNVHFNLLYDHGANPTANYVTDERHVEAESREQLIEKIMSMHRSPDDADAPGDTERRKAARERFIRHVEPDISQDGEGLWVYSRKTSLAILGWDPREVVYED